MSAQETIAVLCGQMCGQQEQSGLCSQQDKIRDPLRRSVGIWRGLVENLKNDEGVISLDLHGKVKKMKVRW